MFKTKKVKAIIPKPRTLLHPSPATLKRCNVEDACKGVPAFLNYKVDDDDKSISVLVACEDHQTQIIFPVLAWGMKTKKLDQKFDF